MATQNAGHARNVANFKEVIIILNNLNGKWNPVQDMLKMPNLETFHLACEAKLSAFNVALSMDSIKTDLRSQAYKPLNDLLTRTFAAMKSCGMDASIIERAKTLKDLISGTNVAQATRRRLKETEKLQLMATTEGVELPEQPKAHSVSQQSYDERLDNFEKFITLLETAANYATNHEGLSLEALKAFRDKLNNANDETNHAYDLAAHQRDQRNEMLYGETDSINVRIDLIKNELISAEGSQGVNYRKVCSYRFVNYTDS